MKIELEKVSKKFGNRWVFRNISAIFETGRPAAITGANGSGKSTLLKLISGFSTPNEGKVLYSNTGKQVPVEEIFRHISISAPYLDLPDELSVSEILIFHAALKPFAKINTQELLRIVDLPADKLIGDCSSGMKQRLKFALAFYSHCDILLLDEPTANMDHYWRNWAIDLICSDPQQRLTIICSNEPYEYEFTGLRIEL